MSASTSTLTHSRTPWTPVRTEKHHDIEWIQSSYRRTEANARNLDWKVAYTSRIALSRSLLCCGRHLQPPPQRMSPQLSSCALAEEMHASPTPCFWSCPHALCPLWTSTFALQLLADVAARPQHPPRSAVGLEENQPFACRSDLVAGPSSTPDSNTGASEKTGENRKATPTGRWA